MTRTRNGQPSAAFKNAQISEGTAFAGVYYYLFAGIALLAAVFLFLPASIQ